MYPKLAKKNSYMVKEISSTCLINHLERSHKATLAPIAYSLLGSCGPFAAMGEAGKGRLKRTHRSLLVSSEA